LLYRFGGHTGDTPACKKAIDKPKLRCAKYVPAIAVTLIWGCVMRLYHKSEDMGIIEFED